MICSGKRGHFAQKLKNELLTWCYSAYLASQNGTYHRAWSPTIAELHALVLSHLQENFNYCIKKTAFLKITCAVRAILTRIRVSIDYADAVPFFFLNECLSLNHALAYLESGFWYFKLCVERDQRPKLLLR